MLSCKDLSVRVKNSGELILNKANVEFMPRAMNAVIGPSGCGKTTLLKAMLKIIDSEGESYFNEELIEKSEDLIGKLGFAPQFTCVHPSLKVEEAIKSALDISICNPTEKKERLEYILNLIKLNEHKDKFITSLSGGQLRRIGLGIELANNPIAMCCDEVTSGLDPLSENAILDILKDLSKNEAKTFICIIHNLAKLDYFDKITVIFKAEVVFQGDLNELKDYFEIDSALALYDKLNEFDILHWRQKWKESDKNIPQISEKLELVQEVRPNLVSQLITLLARRYKMFFRDKTYLFLTLAISFGFPFVVVIFAINGLPELETLALDRSLGMMEELKESLRIQMESAKASALVTGLILFQVVLLALMGSNNSAREISAERNLYEKERLIGLRPCAYALSKIIFTASLAIFQGVWMCVFVKYICQFPGNVLEQCVGLSMLTLAMTAICLAFSAMFSSAEKSNLVSIYLVGFQLPLSGIVLALPEALKWVCRPFISTFWAWSGYMSSMSDTSFYDAYIQTQNSWDYIPDSTVSLIFLAIQMLFAYYFVFIGVYAKKWS